MMICSICGEIADPGVFSDEGLICEFCDYCIASRFVNAVSFKYPKKYLTLRKNVVNSYKQDIKDFKEKKNEIS